MADPGGRTVGRVSLRVIPDTSKLREDLSKVLRRIEATMKVTIPADLDTGGFLTKVRTAVTEANKLARVTANVDLDTNGLKAKVDEAVRRASGATATVNTDLDTGLAAVRLAVFTRPRFVDVIARMNEGSLLRVGTALAALSGGRVLGDVGKKVGNALKNLDRAIPSIAGVTLALGSLGSVALSSVGGLATVAVGIASIAGAGLALPGVLAGIGVGAVTLGLALADIKTQLGSLAPAFATLQNVVSSTFWDAARQPILDLTNSLLPAFQAGMQGTAAALGGLFANLATSLQTSLGGGVLSGMFDNLNAAVGIAAQAMAPLAGIIATLGTVGASYLPGLAQNFTDVTTRINEILTVAAGNGQLQAWIDNGLTAAGQLASVLGSVATSVLGIANAATAAGGGGLATLAAVMAQVSDTINGPAFQGALTTLFTGAAQGVSGLTSALTPIGGLLTTLAPTLASALADIGGIVGQAVGAIATALSGPEVATGISALVGGLVSGIQALLPALAPVAAVLGEVAGVAGVLAAALGPVLGAAAQALAPVLSTLAAVVTPLVDLLGGALVGIIDQVAPILAQVAADYLPALATIIGALVPALETIISAVLPVIGALLEPMGQYIAGIADVIAVLLPPVAELVAQVVSSLAPILTTLAERLLPVVLSTFEALAPVFAELVTALAPLIATIAEALIPFIEALLPVVEAVVAALVPIITAAVGIITGIVKVFSGIVSGDWSKLWEGVKQVLSGAWDLIKGIISGAIQIVVAVLKAAWDLVVATVKQAWSQVAGLVSTAWESLKATVRDGIAALVGFVGPGLAQVIGFFVSLRGKVLEGLGNVGEWLVDSGRKIIDGLVQGIKGAASRVTDAVRDVMAKAREYFPFSPAKKGAFAGRHYTTNSGKALVVDFAAGIRAEQDRVVAATAAMMSAAQPMLREVASGAFQTPAAAVASAVSGPQTFHLYDADRQLIGTMQGIAQGSVASATEARLVATRMGAA